MSQNSNASLLFQQLWINFWFPVLFNWWKVNIGSKTIWQSMEKFPCAVLSVGTFPHMEKEEQFFIFILLFSFFILVFIIIIIIICFLLYLWGEGGGGGGIVVFCLKAAHYYGQKFLWFSLFDETLNRLEGASDYYQL